MFTFDPIAHTYYLDGQEIPGVSDILEEGGLKHGFNGFHDAQLRGLHIHTACELLDLNDLDWTSVFPQWVGYVRSWERFKQETGFVPETIEQRLYHPTYRFGGTLDRRGYFPSDGGRRTILDIKTGAPEDWHAFQTCGYRLLGQSDWRHDARMGVYLKEDGSMPQVIRHDSPSDLQIFLAALTITHYKRSKA